MTRRERHVQVVALKDEGLTFDEIARRLDVGRSTVTGAYYDPDGAKDRERKARRSGSCVDCGKTVTNSGSEPPERCVSCDRLRRHGLEFRRERARSLGGRIKWTEAQILDAVRRFPTCASYRAENVRRPGAIPSAALIRLRFGSWNNAKRRAGLPTQNFNNAGWGVSKDGALLAMTSCADDIGRIPTKGEYRKWARDTGAPSEGTLRAVWGSWMGLVEACAATGRVAA